MITAFEYAKNQILGLQFEPFDMQTEKGQYSWRPSPRITAQIKRLIALDLEWLAALIFLTLLTKGA